MKKYFAILLFSLPLNSVTIKQVISNEHFSLEREIAAFLSNRDVQQELLHDMARENYLYFLDLFSKSPNHYHEDQCAEITKEFPHFKHATSIIDQYRTWSTFYAIGMERERLELLSLTGSPLTESLQQLEKRHFETFKTRLNALSDTELLQIKKDAVTKIAKALHRALENEHADVDIKAILKEVFTGK